MIQTITFKLISSILLVILTIGMGIILHRSGKPYNTGYFTIHKISTIAFLVLLISIINIYLKGGGINSLFTFSCITGSVSLLALIISGALMSLDKMTDLSLLIHRISTFVFVLCLGLFIFSIVPVKS